MQETPVLPGRTYDERVRAVRATGDNHAVGQAIVMPAYEVKGGASQQVVTHLAHERSVNAQPPQRQAGIRYAAACRRHRRAYDGQPAGGRDRLFSRSGRRANLE